MAVLDACACLRWCGLPVLGSSPVMKLTSSGNVMLVTFSFSRQRDGAIFKAYFQAIPKAGGNNLTHRSKHVSYYLIFSVTTFILELFTCNDQYMSSKVLLSILCFCLCHRLPLQVVEAQFPPGTAPFPHPTTLHITLLT